MLRLLILVVLAGAAYLTDMYLDENPVNIEQEQSQDNRTASADVTFVLYNPVNTITVKQDFFKTPYRFINLRLHDKFLQKHHQLRNFHVLKEEPLIQKTPLVLTCHFLIMRNYMSSLPDDEPLIS